MTDLKHGTPFTVAAPRNLKPGDRIALKNGGVPPGKAAVACLELDGTFAILRVRGQLAKVLHVVTDKAEAETLCFRETGAMALFAKMREYGRTAGAADQTEADRIAALDDPTQVLEQAAAYLRTRGLLEAGDGDLNAQLERDGKLLAMPTTTRPQ